MNFGHLSGRAPLRTRKFAACCQMRTIIARQQRP